MVSTVRAMQLGAYDYMVKPLDVDRVTAVVKQALGRGRTRTSCASSHPRLPRRRAGPALRAHAGDA